MSVQNCFGEPRKLCAGTPMNRSNSAPTHSNPKSARCLKNSPGQDCKELASTVSEDRPGALMVRRFMPREVVRNRRTGARAISSSLKNPNNLPLLHEKCYACSTVMHLWLN